MAEAKKAKKRKFGAELKKVLRKGMRPVVRFFSNHTTLLYLILLVAYVMTLIYILYRMYGYA